MTSYELRWHLFGRIVVFGFTMLAVLVTSYIAQERAAQHSVPTVCVASWNCQTGQRLAPRPDTSTMPNNDHPVERTP